MINEQVTVKKQSFNEQYDYKMRTDLAWDRDRSVSVCLNEIEITNVTDVQICTFLEITNIVTCASKIEVGIGIQNICFVQFIHSIIGHNLRKELN